MDKKIPLYWTVIGGLIWTIILIVTFRQCSNPDAVAYIGFAATITSLVLGVVAIFYSIISNNQSSENIGVLREASEKISNGADRTQEVEQKLSSSIENLQEVYREIKGKIDELPAHFKSVEDKWDGTDKFLREKLNAASNNEKEPKETLVISNELIDKFLRKSSFNGLELFYAIHLANQKGEKKIDLSKLEEICRTGESHQLLKYFQGYFIAAVSIGIVTGNTSGISIIEFDKLNEHLSKSIRDAVYKSASKQEKYKDAWIENIKEIEQVFAS